MEADMEKMARMYAAQNGFDYTPNNDIQTQNRPASRPVQGRMFEDAPPMAAPAGVGVVSDKDIGDMKNVLERLNKSTNNVASQLRKEATIEPLLEGYMSNSYENNTIRVGKRYDIKVREIDSLSGSKKIFDIYDSHNNELLANDLFLYEAALGIVRLLNRGEHIYNKNIRKIIALEQKYADARQDTGIYKKRLAESIKLKDRAKIDLYETRWNNSKDIALKIKADIIDLAGL